MAFRVLQTIDFKITTREELWVQIYSASVGIGFSPDIAARETDKAVDLIFEALGTQTEWELRSCNQDGQWPCPILVTESKDSDSS